jgi:hypothetical protein
LVFLLFLDMFYLAIQLVTVVGLHLDWVQPALLEQLASQALQDPTVLLVLVPLAQLEQLAPQVLLEPLVLQDLTVLQALQVQPELQVQLEL